MYNLMSKCISSQNVLNKSFIKLSERHVSYQVLPTGEKVVVNVKSEVTTTREKWQRVRPMGCEPELLEIKKMELNDRLETDPKVARNTASRKLQSLQDSLRQRGFCRETKPYIPPKNVQNLIENICSELYGNKNWEQISFNDSLLKYKFLTKCSKQFDYEIPNSALYLMRKVSDVYQFYSTPIRGITSYDQMVQNMDQLPQNVHVIAEPIRFNPENNEFFGGLNAYPFSASKVTGLRAKKKYPTFKSHFEWPDV